jgi:hypothetical protein
VIDAAALNIHDFLWRDTCVSSTQLNRHILRSRLCLHLEKSKLQEVFISKTMSIMTGK